MNKKQQYVNPISLVILLLFVIVDVLGLLFSIGMQPEATLFQTPLDGLSLLVFYLMLPASIVMLQISKKHAGSVLFWSGMLLVALHFVLIFKDQF